MSRSATAPAASELVERAQADPAGFRQEASDLAVARADDPHGLVELRWALGLAHRECGDLREARGELERAAAEAARLGDEVSAACIRSSLSVVLLHLGETQSALEVTELAATVLTGLDGARNAMQHGVILQRLGRQADAVAAYDEASAVFEAVEDTPALVRLLGNRGILHAYGGRLETADGDLTRSLELARRLGSQRPVALGLQNLGFLRGRQGRIPEALALLEEADDLLRDLDDVGALAVLDTDRAELLAEVGLFEEAIERAEAAAERLAEDHINGSEAGLLVARLCLLAGFRQRAGAIADQLAERFRAIGRTGWELHARYIAHAARDDDDVRVAVALADELDEGGWYAEARAARLRVARHMLERGETAAAAGLLARMRDGSGRAPALVRAHHWYATALARLSAGDRAGARRAVRAGLDVLDRSRLAFGSAELRAYATSQAVDLVRLAVSMALDDGRPAEALRALDRVRATEVGVRVQPPDDPQLADDLTELRRLAEEERRAAQRGGEVATVMRLRARVEGRLRDRTRALGAESGDAAAMRLRVPDVRRRLAGRTMLAYLHLGERLHGIEVGPRGVRAHDLAPLDEVQTQVSYLRAAVRTLAAEGKPAALLEAAETSLARSMTDLVAMLGLDRVEDPAGMVVVPSAALNGLPWTALGRELGAVPTVAPSARSWLTAGSQRRRGGEALLVAGPDLRGAATEVEMLASRYPASSVLQSEHATVQRTLERLPDVDVVHLAAHGRFRSDNPLFSSLRLADGHLTAYELEQLPAVPHLWVLPSCDAAAVTTVGGDAVLGLSTVLLRLGASTIVAPAVEVPDEATTEVMVDLHERLIDDDPPAAALIEVLQAAAERSRTSLAAASSLVVIGC